MIPGLIAAPRIQQPAPYAPGSEFQFFLGQPVTDQAHGANYTNYSIRQICPLQAHTGRQLKFRFFNTAPILNVSFGVQSGSSGYNTFGDPIPITFNDGAPGVPGDGGVTMHFTAIAVGDGTFANRWQPTDFDTAGEITSDWIEVPYDVSDVYKLIVIMDVGVVPQPTYQSGNSPTYRPYTFFTSNGSTPASSEGFYYQANADTANLDAPAGSWQQHASMGGPLIEIRGR